MPLKLKFDIYFESFSWILTCVYFFKQNLNLWLIFQFKFKLLNLIFLYTINYCKMWPIYLEPFGSIPVNPRFIYVEDKTSLNSVTFVVRSSGEF